MRRLRQRRLAGFAFGGNLPAKVGALVRVLRNLEDSYWVQGASELPVPARESPVTQHFTTPLESSTEAVPVGDVNCPLPGKRALSLSRTTNEAT